MKSSSETNQMKVFAHSFSVVLFLMLYKVMAIQAKTVEG